MLIDPTHHEKNRIKVALEKEKAFTKNNKNSLGRNHLVLVGALLLAMAVDGCFVGDNEGGDKDKKVLWHLHAPSSHLGVVPIMHIRLRALQPEPVPAEPVPGVVGWEEEEVVMPLVPEGRRVEGAEGVLVGDNEGGDKDKKVL